MNSKQTFMHILVLCFSLCLVQRTSATEYDDLFDRPTFYPEFKPPVSSPNNMVYYVRAKTKGNTLLSNYEVAVYDEQNKMRATGRSISSQRELCTLVIRGEQGEKLHFEIIFGDFEHPMIVAAEEECIFEINDTKGDIDNPFMLSFSAPTVTYWKGEVSGTPYATVEVTGDMPDLKDALRAELSDNWSGCGLANMFADCTSLLYVTFLSMPATTANDFGSANPNCLKFLSEGVDSAPDGWTNCVDADNNALTDIQLTDGTPVTPCPFYCPTDITLNGHKASFVRSGNWLYANGKGGWNTLVLPFDAALVADGTMVEPLPVLDLGTDTHEVEDLWKKQGGYWACSFTACFGNRLIFSDPLAAAGHLKANTPYLLALPGSMFTRDIGGISYCLGMESKTIEFVSVSGILSSTPTTLCGTADSGSDHCMLGTFSVMLEKPMYLLRNNYTENGNDAFVRLSSGNLLPFRAYVSCPEAVSVPYAFGINIGQDDTTGLNLYCKDKQSKEIVHDLSGRIIDSNSMSRSSGVMIKGNRKIVNVKHQ